jgi:hypothetical protein
MSDGDLSALFTLLAVPVGGLIAWAILWLLLFRKDRND